MKQTLFVKQLEFLARQKKEEIKRLRDLGVRPDETYINFLYRKYTEKKNDCK